MKRSLAGDGDAVHETRFFAIVVNGVMHRTSVVPHNNVTRAPLMALHSVGIGTPLIKKIEQRATFFLGHPFETGG